MNDDHLPMLDELLDLEDGLTAWEVEFLESLNRQRGREFTEKQVSKLEAIYREKCP